MTGALSHSTNVDEARPQPIDCNGTTSVIDFEVLKSFQSVKSDDGSDIVVELIDLYLQGSQQRIAEIQRAAIEQRWDLIKQTAHTLKGSSSTIGVRRIANTCQQIEEADFTSTNNIAALIQMLRLDFRELEPLLIEERNRRSLGQKPR